MNEDRIDNNDAHHARAIIITDEPWVVVLASQELDWEGVAEMARWVRDRRPECVPEDTDPRALFPHDLMRTVCRCVPTPSSLPCAATVSVTHEPSTPLAR